MYILQTSRPVAVENVTKKYGKFTVLKDISFSIEKGEVFGYLGPNGAGKTTTIRLLTGLSRPDSGICRVLGQPAGVDNNLYTRIGVLFEEKNLYEKLTGLQNLKFFAHLYNVNEKRIFQLLEFFALMGTEKKRVETYSKGMKQRLLICRTLLHRPELLILDEPTSGLDPNSAEVIITAIKEYAREGKTVFLSSHNMDEVEEVCGRIAFLKNGKIIDIASPAILKKKYGGADKEVSLKEIFRKITG